MNSWPKGYLFPAWKKLSSNNYPYLTLEIIFTNSNANGTFFYSTLRASKQLTYDRKFFQFSNNPNQHDTF